MSKHSNASSYYATAPVSGGETIDTASSARNVAEPTVMVQHVRMDAGPTPPTLATPIAPNTTYSGRAITQRSRSVSPRLRRARSPQLSVAQLRAQTAEEKADTAISRTGYIEDQAQRAQRAANEAIAEARVVRGEVAMRMDRLVQQAEISTSSAIGALVGQVTQASEQQWQRTSRTVGAVAQQLEHEIGAASSRVAAASEDRMRKTVSEMHARMQAQLDEARAEAACRDATNKAQMQDISVQLAILTEQLNRYRPASVKDVEGSEQRMSSAVAEQLNAHSNSIAFVSKSVEKAQQSAQDNAETLQTLLVGMENLGENVKILAEKVNAEKGDEFEELQEELVAEVPLLPPIDQPQASSLPLVPYSEKLHTPILFPQHTGPSSRPSPRLSLKTPATGAILNTDDEELEALRTRLSALRTSQAETPKIPEKCPGLDKPQRRITPIPVKAVGSQEKKGPGLAAMADESAEAMGESIFPDSSTNRSTIGNTYIPPAERRWIHDEVQAAVNQRFPGIQFGSFHHTGTGKIGFSTTDVTESTNVSEPLAIAGSEVSVARTPYDGGNVIDFARLSQQSGMVNQTQLFATAQWKPKEPPCFYGRYSEDVHIWTSLVRHYLAFMGGSDAQQVAYSVTLLREHAHEWYMGYERRHRTPPRDWPSLATALVERFGSNIRSQEAFSQLMSISQGQRPVQEYASQFELLLGRIPNYNESLMLYLFVWGLQPELARSVSLHYPKSIAQAISLAETTELAVKASRRPVVKNPQTGRAQNPQNRGRGQWRNARGQGRRGGAGGGGQQAYRGRGSGRSQRSGRSYDPLACYQCGVRGHLARDCPQNRQPQGSGNAVPSQRKFPQSGQPGPSRRGGKRPVRFSGLNVLYDEDGNQYPIDDAGQMYVPLNFEQTVDVGVNEEEKVNETKN